MTADALDRAAVAAVTFQTREAIFGREIDFMGPKITENSKNSTTSLNVNEARPREERRDDLSKPSVDPQTVERVETGVSVPETPTKTR